MFDINTLFHTVPIGLLFVLIITGSFKKSITTTIYIVSLVISMFYTDKPLNDMFTLILLFGAILSLIFTMLRYPNNCTLDCHKKSRIGDD